MYDYGGRGFQYSRIRDRLPDTRRCIVIALEATHSNSSPRE